jgi:hypothetical protein
MSDAATCYMCEEPSTSREHAPPKCLFPEPKDSPTGRDLRRNLITVPSCSTHNLRTSMDDEYFLVVSALHFETNDVSAQQFSTKILRALQRRPAFRAGTFAEMFPGLVEGQPSGGFRVDHSRLERIVDKTARAIFHHHHATNAKLTRPIHVHLPALRYTDGRPVPGANELGRLAHAHFGDIPWEGANPEVFCYRFRIDETDEASFLWMRFFSGFQSLVSWGTKIDG